MSYTWTDPVIRYRPRDDYYAGRQAGVSMDYEAYFVIGLLNYPGLLEVTKEEMRGDSGLFFGTACEPYKTLTRGSTVTVYWETSPCGWAYSSSGTFDPNISGVLSSPVTLADLTPYEPCTQTISVEGAVEGKYEVYTSPVDASGYREIATTKLPADLEYERQTGYGPPQNISPGNVNYELSTEVWREIYPGKNASYQNEPADSINITESDPINYPVWGVQSHHASVSDALSVSGEQWKTVPDSYTLKLNDLEIIVDDMVSPSSVILNLGAGVRAVNLSSSETLIVTRTIKVTYSEITGPGYFTSYGSYTLPTTSTTDTYTHTHTLLPGEDDKKEWTFPLPSAAEEFDRIMATYKVEKELPDGSLVELTPEEAQCIVAVFHRDLTLIERGFPGGYATRVTEENYSDTINGSDCSSGGLTNNMTQTVIETETAYTEYGLNVVSFDEVKNTILDNTYNAFNSYAGSFIKEDVFDRSRHYRDQTYTLAPPGTLISSEATQSHETVFNTVSRTMITL